MYKFSLYLHRNTTNSRRHKLVPNSTHVRLLFIAFYSYDVTPYCNITYMVRGLAGL